MRSESHWIVRGLSVAVLVVSCGNEAADDVTRVQDPLYKHPGVQLWTSTHTLPVCWMPATRMYGANWNTEKAWSQAAVTRTWGAVADLKFTWQECPLNGNMPFVTLKIAGKFMAVDNACCNPTHQPANPPIDCCGWDGGSTFYWGTSGLRLPQDSQAYQGETVNIVYRDDGMGVTGQARAEYIAI